MPRRKKVEEEEEEEEEVFHVGMLFPRLQTTPSLESISRGHHESTRQ